MGMTNEGAAARAYAPDGTAWEVFPAVQQPRWRDHPAFVSTRARLSGEAPLVTPSEVRSLHHAMSVVAEGAAHALQLGDCAESFHECTKEHVAEKLSVIDWLSEEMERRTDRRVVRVGRIGGQFAKPRSEPTEWSGEVGLPTFRGHLVNSEVFEAGERRHDPRRMLWGYEASSKTMRWVRDHRLGRQHEDDQGLGSGPWSSHEALVIDYEASLVRDDPDNGRPYLGSTHLPWIGERTRDPDGAHVRLLADVANPVACKVGSKATPEHVRRLCELLDPDRVPGRLVLVVRMGARDVGESLPPVVDAVRSAAWPVTWLVDPMHGNTTRTSDGHKTRHLADIVAEADAAKAILLRHGQNPAGLHLEVAASDVTECVGGPVPHERQVGDHYTTLCDPRLNPEQAHQVVDRWLRS